MQGIGRGDDLRIPYPGPEALTGQYFLRKGRQSFWRKQAKQLNRRYFAGVRDVANEKKKK
jgi:hypothetical protein